MPGPRDRFRLPTRRFVIRPIVLVIQLVVLALLGGGVATYASYGKTVRVSVDGQIREVHTFAHSAGGVLDRVGVTLGSHDVVAPQPTAEVDDGDVITVWRGRPINLVLDGSPVQVWVTAGTVDEALRQIGLTETGAYVSASGTKPVPVSGIGLIVRLPHRFSIAHDGKVTKLHSSVATVRQALALAHVRLAKTDKVSAALGSIPRDGQVIKVTRIHNTKVTRTTTLPYRTVRIADGDMYRGSFKVTNAGHSGVLVRHYRLTFVNGKVKARALVSYKVVRKPHARVVRFGTKPRPIDELNWYALAGCESGHNSRAYSPQGYYGLYQFSMGTWRSLGGSGDPRDASEREQTYRAQLLYKRAGASAWPSCGHYLYEH